MMIILHFAVTFAGVSLVYNARAELVQPRLGLPLRWDSWQYLIPFALTVATVGRAIVSGLRLGLALESRSWPTVQGTILQSKQTGSGLKVNYSFAVGDQSFQGDAISFGHAVIDRRKQPDRFAPETTVDVFYDPAHPDISCLIPGVSKFQVLGELALCFILGAMCTYVAMNTFS